MEILKVGDSTKVNKLAGAISNCIRRDGKVELQSVGVGALNQAVKAVAIARGFVAPSGIDLVATPSFVDVVIEGNERTAIRLLVNGR